MCGCKARMHALVFQPGSFFLAATRGSVNRERRPFCDCGSNPNATTSSTAVAVPRDMLPDVVAAELLGVPAPGVATATRLSGGRLALLLANAALASSSINIAPRAM